MTSSTENGCCGHCTCSQGSDNQGENPSRRDFLGGSAALMGAAGAAAVAWPLVDSMNPAADTLALGTTDVDISNLKEGMAITVMWRGAPVFVRYRTQQEIAEAQAAHMDELKDPESDEVRVAQSSFNGTALPHILVTKGVCTHLGCIPLGQKPTDPHGEFGGWFCPCHGSQYDTSGRIRKGPAPKNLEVPPYVFLDAHRIRIGKSAKDAA